LNGCDNVNWNKKPAKRRSSNGQAERWSEVAKLKPNTTNAFHKM